MARTLTSQTHAHNVTGGFRAAPVCESRRHCDMRGVVMAGCRARGRQLMTPLERVAPAPARRTQPVPVMACMYARMHARM